MIAVAKDLGAQYGGPGSNAGKFFLTFFMNFCYPVVTVLLEHFNPTIYSCLIFALQLYSCLCAKGLSYDK